jgi:hypothetical protein
MERGVISAEQLHLAVREQHDNGKRLGEILLEHGMVQIRDILEIVVEQHRTDMNTDRVGDVLVDMGVLNRVQVGQARAAQDLAPGRPLLGEVLLAECMVTQAELLDAIDEQLRRRAAATDD